MGFETEFILLKNTNPIEAVNRHGWCNSAALASGTTETQVLEEIADALRAADIELQMYHAEAAPGQYEIVTVPPSSFTGSRRPYTHPRNDIQYSQQTWPQSNISAKSILE